MPRITRRGSHPDPDPVVAAVEPPAAEAVVPPTPLSPPPRTALKSVWVAYALELGVDASGSKPDIMRRVG